MTYCLRGLISGPCPAWASSLAARARLPLFRFLPCHRESCQTYSLLVSDNASSLLWDKACTMRQQSGVAPLSAGSISLLPSLREVSPPLFLFPFLFFLSFLFFSSSAFFFFFLFFSFRVPWNTLLNGTDRGQIRTILFFFRFAAGVGDFTSQFRDKRLWRLRRRLRGRYERIDDEKYFEIDESFDHLLLDLSETRKSSQKKKKIIGFSFWFYTASRLLWREDIG